MKKVLGLDLGVNSIGWALVNESEKPEEQSSIIKAGVRIAPIITKELDSFNQGEKFSLNMQRRMARGSRRCLQRFKLRRSALAALLRKNSIISNNVKLYESGNATTFETYRLRAKAVTEELTLEEFARVLMMINKKRGYKSNRKANNSDEDVKTNENYGKEQKEKTSDYLGGIIDRHNERKSQNITVGQYLMQKLDADSSAPLKNLVFYRSDYFDEFNTIWDKQATYHKELTAELKKTVAGIIFMQRPLKSQKGNVGYCEFESRTIEIMVDGKMKKCTTGSKVCPKSSPLFQEFKVWQLVNNIEITNLSSGEKRLLDAEERQRLVDELTVEGKLTQSVALGCLFPKQKFWKMNYDKLDGDTTQSTLFKAYQKIIEASGNDALNFSKLPAKKAVDAVKEIFDALGFNTDFITFDSGTDGNAMKANANYKLWHLLYSFESDNSTTGNEKLIEKIMKECGMPREYAKILAAVTFPDDYGNLSAKAILKVLPYLRQGLVYSDACEKAGYRHSDESLTVEENEKRILVDHLENIPKNSLRNPVVEKILNQMVNVVNALVDRYGRMDEVRIELARELKNNVEQRRKINKANDKSRKENETLRKELLENEFFQNIIPSKNDIIRYRLYKELVSNGHKTLYSNTPIKLEELFTEKYEIEHIIPKARLFDDSYSNKTLELSSVNKKKDKKTAYDFILENYGEENAVNYKNMVDRMLANKEISKTKHDHLLMHESDIPKDFLNRDLAQTQYISKKARQILLSMFRHVTVTTGSITARLREDWQLVNVMKELNLPKYEQLNMTYEVKDRHNNTRKYIKDWSKRNDHRHHAMDAITIAFTKPVYIQYLNNVNAHNEKTSEIYGIQAKYLKKDKNGNLRFIPPVPLAKFRREAEKQLSDILISIKAKNKVLTRNVNKTKVPNSREVRRTVQFTPRGELHKATIYGKIKRRCMVTVNGKMTKNVIAKVANKKYREALICRLAEFDNDPKKAFGKDNSLEKYPLYTNSLEVVPQKVELADIVDRYTKRKAVDKLLNVEKVVDAEVRRTLEKRIAEFGGKQDKAFANLDENPIRMKNGKIIKRVTVAKGLQKVVALHDKRDYAGNVILDAEHNTQPVDFVTPNNNHHIALYEDKCGKWYAKIVTFMEAVERANANLPIIDKALNAELGWRFLFSIKNDEYFVFPNEETGFDPKSIDLTNPTNYSKISPNLFRNNGISMPDSKVDCSFTHHLETENKDARNAKDLKNIAWKRVENINVFKQIVKVRINHIGEIVSVGEYQ